MKNFYKYKTCEDVPCGSQMIDCPPEYCYPNYYNSKASGVMCSKNWGICNMKKYKNTKKCKKIRNKHKTCTNLISKELKKSDKLSVKAKELHMKLPFIWRFLKGTTMKKILQLGNQDIKDINIFFDPFKKFPYKTLKKKYKNDKQQLKELNKKLKHYNKTRKLLKKLKINSPI